ncbi:superoxide dismutase family protein [Parachlamydia sp. AcF125]|uniref:superoxide dismutase family protein n=1 Tax=Parachlamydia sp. AcF125 TaxID=2795736 RepID=UPI001BC954FF|nr:superoxide dismutase family protein [Parachlamydia sp. AcF125]MBS4168392.1 Superoxide dismutase [Cu-Zn] [Parachlamydia sp. AcF125]
MRKLLAYGLCLFLLTSCHSSDRKAEAPHLIKKANAVVNPTQGHKTWGSITFTETKEGVLIVANIQGLPPGKHGFHVHEFGDCSAPDASSAGGPYEPAHPKTRAENTERYISDLGNLEANEKGHAFYERLDRVITLNGPNSILGKSVVIHQNEDDFKIHPAGSLGKRMACGLILPVEE